MTTVCTIEDLDSIEDLEKRLAQYKAIRDALILGAASFVPKAGVQQHKLDDGQVIIETKYGTMKEYMAGLVSVEQLINMTDGLLNGNISSSRDPRDMC